MMKRKEIGLHLMQSGPTCSLTTRWIFLGKTPCSRPEKEGVGTQIFAEKEK